MSIKHTDNEAAAVAVAERVTLADIEAAIADKFHLNGRNAVIASLAENGVVSTLAADQHADKFPGVAVLSICILVMKNGFTVIGKSAPASPENFNADLGRKFAYEDCIRQLWPLMGFALRNKLAGN